MRPPKNRLQDLAQSLQRHQAQPSASGQGKRRDRKPSIEAKSFDHNQSIDLQTSGQGQRRPSSSKASVEAKAFDHNEPIELRYSQETGSYVPSPPPYVAAQAVDPDLDLGSEAFEVESFDPPEPVTTPAPTPSIQPEVVDARSYPSPTKAAAPIAQPVSVDAGVEPQSTAPPAVVTADDFLEDLQSILKGEKTYDTERQQVVDAAPSSATPPVAPAPAIAAPVEPEKTSSPHAVFDRMAQGLPPEPSPTALPTPTYASAHSVFDRMGKNMAFANSFDLGTITLEQRFDEFDRILDAEEQSSQSQTKSFHVNSPSNPLSSASSSVSVPQATAKKSVVNIASEQLSADFSDAIAEAMTGGESIKIWLASWNCENQEPDETTLEKFMIPDFQSLPAASRPDLIVIALQEAKRNSSIIERLALKTEYILEDKAQKLDGMTKGTPNCQKLAVLRKPSVTVKNIEGDVSKSDYWGGKGGCYLSFDYSVKNRAFESVKLGFIGAHLDSKDDNSRKSQIDDLLMSINRAPYRDAKEIKGEFQMTDFDGIFFMGDLNYRLVDLPGQPVKQDFSRFFLPRMINDPGLIQMLTMDSLRNSSLVGEHRFEFPDPNPPFLPTYKRDYKTVENNPCLLLAEMMPRRDIYLNSVDPLHRQAIPNAIRECYFSHQQEKFYDEERQAYNLGWLDRVGFKISKPMSLRDGKIIGGKITRIDVEEFKSYDEIILSDHTPILMKVQAWVLPSDLKTVTETRATTPLVSRGRSAATTS